MLAEVRNEAIKMGYKTKKEIADYVNWVKFNNELNELMIKFQEALIKAVTISEVIISLIFIGEINKFVKFLLHISSRKSMLNPMLVLNKKS